jgi:hypothetical protein
LLQCKPPNCKKSNNDWIRGKVCNPCDMCVVEKKDSDMAKVESHTQYTARLGDATSECAGTLLRKESPVSTYISIECGRRWRLDIDKIPEFVKTLQDIAKAGT